MVKYIIKPDTSTKVATNGAEAVAGSILNFRSTKGIIDPDIVPQSTISNNEQDTLNAT